MFNTLSTVPIPPICILLYFSVICDVEDDTLVGQLITHFPVMKKITPMIVDRHERGYICVCLSCWTLSSGQSQLVYFVNLGKAKANRRDGLYSHMGQEQNGFRMAQKDLKMAIWLDLLLITLINVMIWVFQFVIGCQQYQKVTSSLMIKYFFSKYLFYSKYLFSFPPVNSKTAKHGRPANVPKGTKMVNPSVLTIRDPFGPSWTHLGPAGPTWAMFGHYWSKMDHFWTIPTRERWTPK